MVERWLGRGSAVVRPGFGHGSAVGPEFPLTYPPKSRLSLFDGGVDQLCIQCFQCSGTRNIFSVSQLVLLTASSFQKKVRGYSIRCRAAALFQ